MKASAASLRAFWVVPLVLAAMLCTGCVGVIPLPASSARVQSGQRVTRDQVSFVQPGCTTRAELTSQLGTNYLSLPQERAIAYSWEVEGGGGVWWCMIVVPYGALVDGGSWTGGWRAYFVAFDENDVVAATAFKSPSARFSLHEHLEDWVWHLDLVNPTQPTGSLSADPTFQNDSP